MATAVSYQFEAHRFYADHERYCNGSGLSFFTEDLTRAESMFKTYQRDRKETYSVSVTRCDTGEVLLHAGPSANDTERSMHRAWARRHRS